MNYKIPSSSNGSLSKWHSISAPSANDWSIRFKLAAESNTYMNIFTLYTKPMQFNYKCRSRMSKREEWDENDRFCGEGRGWEGRAGEGMQGRRGPIEDDRKQRLSYAHLYSSH
jgi:hypothetical protein